MSDASRPRSQPARVNPTRSRSTKSVAKDGPQDRNGNSQVDGNVQVEAAYASDLPRPPKKRSNSKRGTAKVQPVKKVHIQVPPISEGLPLEQRGAEVLRVAENVFAQTGSWVVFYRTMMAPGGVVDQLFESADERRYFETTDAFAELLEIVTSIRSQDDAKAGAYEPERVVTVRMPRSFHEATSREAEELGLSMNKYCLTKLLQPASKRYTPLESGFRRGRRPGPQIIVGKMKTKKPS